MNGTDDKTSSFGELVAVSDDGSTVAVVDTEGYGLSGSITVYTNIYVGEWQQKGFPIAGDLNDDRTLGTHDTLQFDETGNFLPMKRLIPFGI